MNKLCNSKPTVLLLDSGGGWLEGQKSEGGCLSFSGPLYSILYNQVCAGKASPLSSPSAILPDGEITVAHSDCSLETSPCPDPFAALEEHLSKGLIGVGYLGYELSSFTDISVRLLETEPRYPSMCVHFFRPEDGVVSGIDELDHIIPKEGLSLSTPPSPPLPVPFDLRPNITLDAYLQMVNAARGYISRGDVYQVNLSQRLSAPSHSSLDPHLYLRFLYEAQPVPYAALIDCPGFTLVSGSMELFLEKRGRTLVTKPIKGTRKRGVDSQEDEILRNELLSSPKERAENLMIVDLMRNDLSKIAIPGSVEVKSLFRVKAYRTVHQMVSVISGELREGLKTADILRATFPPGSVTGAPKRRAVEIISELESHARGPYCGAVGVFYPNGDIRLSVAIRVAAISEAGLDCWVGGGIVWDSEPELEYEEALIKARAVKGALLRLRK